MRFLNKSVGSIIAICFGVIYLITISLVWNNFKHFTPRFEATEINLYHSEKIKAGENTNVENCSP